MGWRRFYPVEGGGGDDVREGGGRECEGERGRQMKRRKEAKKRSREEKKSSKEKKSMGK